MNTKESKSLLSPIVLFVYNRPLHTKRTIKALQKNELAKESELFIYSDAPKDEKTKSSVEEVRRYIKSIDGFKSVTIIEREKNWGLADSIIDGVTKIVNEYGKIIVLEDDLVTSPYFLRFMNEALEFYEESEDVYSITGFNYPLKIDKFYSFGTYLYPRASSKSWAIWKDRWRSIEFDIYKIELKWNANNIKKKLDLYGKDLYRMYLSQINNKIDSWAIRYGVNQIMSNKYTVYPVKSYIKDIGDDCGTHAKNSLPHRIVLASEINSNFAIDYNDDIANLYSDYLKKYFFKAKIYALKNKITGLLNVG